ncbi:hypothetical protein ACIGW3_26180 [Streptomyces sp. NPDC053499]|uniref:hypothetical protein n=1 Tax=Streptomyces sp. NPDC053499 TaxID=3365707 RepID=UPI0037CED3FB
MQATDQPQPPDTPTTRGRSLLASPQITAYDNHGSVWSTGLVSPSEVTADIKTSTLPVHTWNTTTRDGAPLTVVRIPDPTFLDTIYAIEQVPA